MGAPGLLTRSLVKRCAGGPPARTVGRGIQLPGLSPGPVTLRGPCPRKGQSPFPAACFRIVTFYFVSVGTFEPTAVCLPVRLPPCFRKHHGSDPCSPGPGPIPAGSPGTLHVCGFVAAFGRCEHAVAPEELPRGEHQPLHRRGTRLAGRGLTPRQRVPCTCIGLLFSVLTCPYPAWALSHRNPNALLPIAFAP